MHISRCAAPCQFVCPRLRNAEVSDTGFTAQIWFATSASWHFIRPPAPVDQYPAPNFPELPAALVILLANKRHRSANPGYSWTECLTSIGTVQLEQPGLEVGLLLKLVSQECRVGTGAAFNSAVCRRPNLEVPVHPNHSLQPSCIMVLNTAAFVQCCTGRTFRSRLSYKRPAVYNYAHCLAT